MKKHHKTWQRGPARACKTQNQTGWAEKPKENLFAGCYNGGKAKAEEE
jgi:hypothetical protein